MEYFIHSFTKRLNRLTAYEYLAEQTKFNVRCGTPDDNFSTKKTLRARITDVTGCRHELRDPIGSLGNAI